MARHKHHKRPQSPTGTPPEADGKAQGASSIAPQTASQNTPQPAPQAAFKDVKKEQSSPNSAPANNQTDNRQTGNQQTGNQQAGNQQRRDDRRNNDPRNAPHSRNEQNRNERPQPRNSGEQAAAQKPEQKIEQKPEQPAHQQSRGNERGQQREFQPRQQNFQQNNQRTSGNFSENRSESRPDQYPRPERAPFGRGGENRGGDAREQRTDFRPQQRTESGSDNRSDFRPRPSRPPATPDFLIASGGYEKPEDVDDFAVRRGGAAYEPYVPKTPAKGSDNIFYKDFSPLFVGARGLAIKILTRLDQSDSYLDKLVEHELAHADLKPLDRALLTEIVHGVTRWQAKLDWVLTGFYHGEFVKCIVPVKNAMRIALYQIMFLQKIPPFAAVNESVELVKRLKGPRSANLVNAILRNILHNLANIRYPQRFEDVPRHLSVVYSHPFWLTKRWFDRFGEEDAEALLRTNNERPKITLRLNMMRCNRQELLNFLDEQQIKYWESTIDAERLLMVGSLSAVRDWKPFQDGWFSVQDPSAAMVVKLANPQPGQLIYDVCSAPGGKATFAAELTNDGAKILALDKYAGKLQRIQENAERLRLTCITTQAQDVRHFKPKELADLVLVDAPCSGLGTLAKKPDIKWKFDLVHFPAMVKTQREVLVAAARTVKVGGTLVYSTCTIEPEENEKQIEWFLQKFPEFELDPADNYLPAHLCTNGFLQTFPHKHQTDGAFGARLVKKR
jgi:16S rRNA (cytosine967-C5)-methyltransferase